MNKLLKLKWFEWAGSIGLIITGGFLTIAKQEHSLVFLAVALFIGMTSNYLLFEKNKN